MMVDKTKKILYLTGNALSHPRNIDFEEKLLRVLAADLPIDIEIYYQPSTNEIRNIITNQNNIRLLIIDTFLKKPNDGLIIYLNELNHFKRPIIILTYKTQEELGMILRENDLYRQKSNAEDNPQGFVDVIKNCYSNIIA